MPLLTPSPDIPLLADLLDRLGGISADRVRYYPLPGTATEADVIAIEKRENRLCELVDGVLVEKPMGIRESLVAVTLSTALSNFVDPRDLGLVSGEGGMIRLFPGMVRIPDVAYISRQRLPGGHVPTDPVPGLAPDLVVEVLSESNTAAEMERKRREYFQAGVELVVMVDLEARSVVVYSSVDDFVTLTGKQELEGGSVLPGFSISLERIFARLDF
ncbi:MAG TPA: Uma2 family endonuclease [Tepidisphaeraceae bacterium]|nr:Uma2 family endonuclease [Tepidisphaeraceae bacterium]